MVSNKKIKINSKEISYKLMKRKGVRAVKLSLYADGYISVTAPKWYPLYLIEKFLLEKSKWILANISENNFSHKKEREEYEGRKEEARKVIEERLKYWNQFYKFKFGRVAIRNQRNCWGSCSEKKNLNFNYKIIKLPESLQDYIIVHELCHLKELNHSKDFWEEVSKTIPDFKEKRRELRKIKI